MSYTKMIAAMLAMAVMAPVTAAGHDSPRVNVIRGQIEAELAALAPAAGPLDKMVVRPPVETAKPETTQPIEPAQERSQHAGENLWTVDAETGAVSVCFVEETLYVGGLEIVCVGRDRIGNDDLTLAE